MIVPRSRLIWLFALGVVPVAALAPWSYGAAVIAVFVTALVALLAVLDAVNGGRARGVVSLKLPPLVRMSHRAEQVIELTVQNDTGSNVSLKTALVYDGADVLEFIAPPGTSRTGWTLRANARGRFMLTECWYETPSPMGLWSVRYTLPVECEVRVYPDLAAEHRKLAALLTRRHGMDARRVVGRGREFEKLREYSPGDPLDEINWKATARRASLVTKVFQVERSQDIYVVVDASRLSGRDAGGDTVLERYIAAALICGASAQRQGDRFGLVTFSDQVHQFIRASSGRPHFGVCRDAILALAPRPVVPDYQELMTLLRMQVRRRAMIIFLTELDDPVQSESFLAAVRLITRQHLVHAITVTPAEAVPLFHGEPPSTVEAIYEKLGGHLEWRRLRETGSALQRAGVRFASSAARDLTFVLTSAYLAAKKEQRI